MAISSRFPFTPESPVPRTFADIDPSANRPAARVYSPENTSFFGRMSQVGRNIASRIYDGVYKMPLANRIIGRLEIAYNQIWLNRHEGGAARLKDRMDSLDLTINALDQTRTDMEAAIENLRRQGMPGVESLRLELGKIDQRKRDLLNKKDKIQSKFEKRDNEAKLYANSRDVIADKLINYYDNKLRPMERELVSLQTNKDKMDSIAVMSEERNDEALTRLADLENRKTQLAEALSHSGMSSRAVSRNEAIRTLDALIRQGHANMQMEAEKLVKRKSEINKKIVKINKRSNPRRDRREEFVRIKEGRPLDMVAGVRNRSAGVDRMEAVNSHMRETREKEVVEAIDVNPVLAANDGIPENVVESDAKVTGIDKKKLQKEKWEEFLTLLGALKKQKEAGETGTDNEKYKMARAAAWHTIHKLENSPDLTYEDLNADNMEDSDKKLLELTRRLWTELTVHDKPDQDARTCLKLMELAGIDISGYKTMPHTKMAESGFAMDFGNRHGVSAEEEGKRIIIDHHGGESDRSTSAAKFVYEMLVEMGLLQKEAYLDKFIAFTTVCDNMDFTPDEMNQVYQNYPKNLYGLAYRMEVTDVIELFKGGVDPMADLPEEYLTKHQYWNPGSRAFEPLLILQESKGVMKRFGLVGHMERQMNSGEKELDRMEKVGRGKKRAPENMEKNDFMVDTGEDRFGKILIDTKKNIDKDRYFNRVDGENHSEQMAVFLRGYGGYLVWSPKEDSFVLFTQRKMDEASLPGGLAQGFNMRGNMWMKPQCKDGESREELIMTLEELLAKLSGKDDFKIEGKLKKVVDTDARAKELLNLVDENNLTTDTLRKVMEGLNAKEANDLFMDALRQRKNGLNAKFQEALKKQPKDKKTLQDKNRIIRDILLEASEKNVTTS